MQSRPTGTTKMPKCPVSDTRIVPAVPRLRCLTSVRSIRHRPPPSEDSWKKDRSTVSNVHLTFTEPNSSKKKPTRGRLDKYGSSASRPAQQVRRALHAIRAGKDGPQAFRPPTEPRKEAGSIGDKRRDGNNAQGPRPTTAQDTGRETGTKRTQEREKKKSAMRPR